MKKKIFSILLIAVLVLSSFATVFADDTTPATGKTITLTNGKAGHTYTVYQVFAGDTTDNPNELINIQWGDDAPAALKSEYATAAAAAEDIATKDARTWAQGYTFTGGKSQTLAADGPVEFTGLAEGFYVILDANNNEDAVEGDFSSAIIVQVVGDVDMALKGDAPTSEKKVCDNNDTEYKFDLSGLTNTDDRWQDSADHDFGDAVPFKLTATTANNVAAYRKYHVTFQDKQDAGLTAPESYTIYVLGKEFTLNATGDAPAAQVTDNGTKISVATATPEGSNTFAIKVTLEQNDPTVDDEGDITSYLNAECNSTPIIVRYTSVLNTDAVIGATGNWNEMYIKYSNNPEDKDDKDEGKTKEDKVVVFTYKTVVDKVDETGADLAGADFTFYKEVVANEEGEYPAGAQKGSAIKEGWEKKVKDAAGALDNDKYYVAVANKTIAGEKDNQFEFKGLDDGKYVLVETTVPSGYNAFEAVEVTISATHTDGNTPALTELTCTDPFSKSNKDAGVVERKDGERTHERVSGEAYAEIVNNSGATLPETGGMGTTIIYILGAALVIGAGVVLVSRKRSNDR